MATVALKIRFVKSNIVKVMQFEGTMLVYDVCKLIREKATYAYSGQSNEYGLFEPDEDHIPGLGRWLELSRTLDYYRLKSGSILEYRTKLRPLRVKTLDDSIKTLLVDDSQTVAELTRVVCARIGLQNPEEFSFTTDNETLDMADKNFNWLNPNLSLREQGIEENVMLTLRKKFFFFDQNLDRNDPVQLYLVYAQFQKDIIKGSHPCTRDVAIQLAALQSQIQFGNHNEAKHKPGFLNLDNFLPKEYVRLKGIEKSIFSEHRKLHNLSEINAKYRYFQLVRSLRTFGVTFFLIKEKTRGRKKLVPRLLGVTRESIMRVDVNTKEVLKTWPLTIVRRWAASDNTFTLDFGDYSDSFYSVQTTEGETISQLIAGYIDIIMKKKKPIHADTPEEDDEPVMVEEEIIKRQQANQITFSQGNHGYVEGTSVTHHIVPQNLDMSAGEDLPIETIPMFLKHPESVMAKPGSDVKFSVKFSIEATYNWYFEEQQISSEGTDYGGSTTDSLTVTKCLSKHKGAYKCVVTDEFDRTFTSKSATLRIDGEEIQKEESKLLGEILRKASINLATYGVDVEQLAEGKCKHTYEEMQYVLRSNPAQHVLSLNLKEELTSRLKEENLYKEAMAADQKVSLSYTKILALGPGQVGKSTFLYRLLGLMKGNIQTAAPEMQPQCSTGVAELREACITYTCRTGALTSESWQVFDESSDLQCQLEGLMSLIVEQTVSKTQQTPVLEKKEPLASKSDASAVHSSRPRRKNKGKKVFEYIKGRFQKRRSKFVGVRVEILDQPSSLLASDPSNSMPSQSLPKTPSLPPQLSNIDIILNEFESIQKDCKLALSKTKFRMLFNIADIGGQPAFLEMLPSLTIGPAMYLVFMKLLQGLTTQYPVAYKCKDGRGSKLCKNYTYTSEEVIFTALSSIACFGNSDSEVEQYVTPAGDKKQTNSLALLVGTFKDKMKDEKLLEDIDHNLQQKLELTDFFSDGLIHSKSFLHVNNFSAPETELEGHRKLLQEILDQKFRKYDIPTRWLTLSICLKLLARLENRHEVSFDDCVQLGSRIGMSKEMVKIALQFLHKYIGLVMYFPNNNFLKDLVICDPQIVFSSISELIFDIYDPRKMYVTEAQHDHFVRTGCFSPQDIKPIHDEKKCLPINALVHLLVHLNIIAEVPSTLGAQRNSLTENKFEETGALRKEYYFLPAVLQTAVLTPLSRGANEEQLPEPLCIGFKTGYLPLGFACALSANLIAESNFELIPFEVNCQQITYKNKIRFRFQGKFDIIMTSGPKYCELQVTRCSDGAVEYWDSECCPRIKTIICEAADRVIQSMQHGSLYKLSKSYELAFKCPNHSDTEIGHEPLAKVVYDSLGKPTGIVCINSSCKIRTHLSPAMRMWFGEAIQTLPLIISRGTSVLDNKIKIQAEGTKPLKYQWLKDDERLSDSDNYEGVTTAELAILGTGSGLKGKYKCQVHDKYGEIFSKEVLYDPFVKELKDKGLEDGEISKLIGNGVGTLEDLKSVTKDNVSSFSFNFGEENRVIKLVSSFIQTANQDPFSGQALHTESKDVDPHDLYAEALKGPTVVLTVDNHLQKVKDLIWKARVQWSPLAGALGVPHDTVEEIRYDLYCRSDGDRLERVLVEWMSGGTATKCDLIKALGNPAVNHRDLCSHLYTLEGIHEILEKLMKNHNMSSEQLECEIEEGDITYLAVYFDNVESYLNAMQLTESEQIEVTKIQDNETAVCQCLSFWRRSESTTAATLRTLLEILVSLRKEEIASRVCNYYYPKQK